MTTPEPEDEARPKWEWALPEEIFRAITRRIVVRIHHGWRLTNGTDQSESWIDLHQETDGFNSPKQYTTTRVMDCRISALRVLFEFNPDHAGLLRLTREGERARDRVHQIDRFKKRNRSELRTYERLKKKFGGGA